MIRPSYKFGVNLKLSACNGYLCEKNDIFLPSEQFISKENQGIDIIKIVFTESDMVEMHAAELDTDNYDILDSQQVDSGHYYTIDQTN